jgi:DNA-binding MarR family transcriptional regulator
MQGPLFQQFVSFTSAVHRVTTDISKGIQLDSVTPVQYKILEYITVSQPVTISQISECIAMSMPNTSRELKKLVEKELCEKVTVSEDRRKQSIQLSAKGQQMMDEVFQELQARFVERTKNITEEEAADIVQALKLLQSKIFY